MKASGRVRTEAENKEGLEYKVLPFVDQDQTYGAVFERLNQGGCIGVFPEGESNSYKTPLLTLQAARTTGPIFYHSKLDSQSWL